MIDRVDIGALRTDMHLTLRGEELVVD